jgi:hypothetical protein
VGKVISLRGSTMSLDTDLGRELVVEFVRYVEGLTDESTIRKKFRFDNEVWEKLGADDAFAEAVETERIRRTRDGSAKREKSQQLITKAPGILDSIMTDPAASPRHRVDAIKTLDTFASNGPEGTTAGTRFVIQINLGTDRDGKEIIERYDRSIEVNPNDRDPHDPNPTTQMFPAIAAKKKDDDQW